ncbi:MAG: hypothetical protein WC859_10315 [Elusimicrobiota bacterium]|jgi:hypothetical protein
MAKPNAQHHNPDPAYLLQLLEKAELSQSEAARRLGISDRMMRLYLAFPERRDGQGTVAKRVECPYPIQYCLEQLASGSRRQG